MILGANPAVWMYSGGAGFAQIFYNIATDEQKKWAEFVAERGWGATMVLTEPDAGSMWAPAAPRPSSRTTAHGTSTV